MLNFEEELKKFKPSLEVEEIEDSIGQGNTVDVVELINQIINTEKQYVLMGYRLECIGMKVKKPIAQ